MMVDVSTLSLRQLSLLQRMAQLSKAEVALERRVGVRALLR